MFNPITAIGEAITNHRRERMRGDIMAILKTEYGFNAYANLIPSTIQKASTRSYNLVENLVWYSASETALRDFYTSASKQLSGYDDSTNYFWAKAKKMRLCHTGLAREIAIKQDTILFGSGYSIQASVFKQDDNGIPTKAIDEKLTAKAQEIVKQLINEVNLRQVMKKAAQANSWSGHVAIKTAFCYDLSPYAILMVYDARNFDLIQQLGLTKSIVFHNYLDLSTGKDEVEHYRHDEIYSTDSKGFATIVNSLTRIKNNKEELIPWEHAQTIFPQFENTEEIHTFETKGMLAWDVPNIVVSNIDGNNPYGQSDYEAAKSSFDLVDECYSALPRELRDKRFIKLIPENRIARTESGQQILDDGFTTNYIQTRPIAQGESEQTFECPPDETENHIRKYNAALIRAINACGLAPSSLGITGFDSVASSDDTIREKSRATLETRNSKLEIWKPILEKMIVQLIVFIGEMQRNKNYLWNAGVPDLRDITWSNADVNVQFSDYLQSSMDEKITTWGNAKTQGIASLEEVIKNLHTDWNKDQLDEEIKRIKFEQGIAVDDPNMMNEDDFKDEDNKDETKEAK